MLSYSSLPGGRRSWREPEPSLDANGSDADPEDEGEDGSGLSPRRCADADVAASEDVDI